MINKSVEWKPGRGSSDSGWQQQPEPAADPAAFDKMIGRRLKTSYADSQQLPMPQQFQDLLRALDEASDGSAIHRPK